MLQTDIGRGREELLHLSEKVTEREILRKFSLHSFQKVAKCFTRQQPNLQDILQ